MESPRMKQLTNKRSAINKTSLPHSTPSGVESTIYDRKE